LYGSKLSYIRLLNLNLTLSAIIIDGKVNLPVKKLAAAILKKAKDSPFLTKSVL